MPPVHERRKGQLLLENRRLIRQNKTAKAKRQQRPKQTAGTLIAALRDLSIAWRVERRLAQKV